MAPRVIAVKDRVCIEGRVHPTKPGWLQVNGEVISILYADEEEEFPEEPEQVMVQFGEGDTEFFQVDELEWTDAMSGYWYKP